MHGEKAVCHFMQDDAHFRDYILFIQVEYHHYHEKFVESDNRYRRSDLMGKATITADEFVI